MMSQLLSRRVAGYSRVAGVVGEPARMSIEISFEAKEVI